MTILPPQTSGPMGPLDKVLAAMSIVTILATVPQALNVWIGPDASGVSLVSWVAYFMAACLWFVHGVRRHDRSIYLACIGWMCLDAAIVIGVLVRR